MHAIVLDGHLKSALASVRSLGVSGIKVSVGAPRTSAMALHSRYAAHAFVYPSPYTAQGAFVKMVREEAVRLGSKPVVYAFSDATFLSLYAFRKELEDVITIQYPEEKSMEIAFDKAATYSLARVSGVPVIPTFIPETPHELCRIAGTLSYPAVVKARKSVTWKDDTGIFGSAAFVMDAAELEQKFREDRTALGEAPMIQQFIRGEEYGVEMLAAEGTVYAQVVHHRLRSLSPTGGASVLKETLCEGALYETLLGHATSLVTELKWTGPIMVEFKVNCEAREDALGHKVDADGRTPYLMEINGRFWGSLPLSIFAGADMPILYYAHLTTGAVPLLVKGRGGVTSVHRAGDVAHLLRVLFSRSRMRKILYPKRSQAVRDFFSLPRGVRHDVWSFADPKPACMEIIDILKTKLWK